MQIDELVAEWQIAEATLRAAKERFDKIQNELAQQMLVSEVKSEYVTIHGEDYKVTVVAAESTTVDAEALKKDMGAVAFRKVCKQRVDNKLLELAIRDGIVSADTVAKHVIIKSNVPYVRVTRVTGE